MGGSCQDWVGTIQTPIFKESNLDMEFCLGAAEGAAVRLWGLHGTVNVAGIVLPPILFLPAGEGGGGA